MWPYILGIVFIIACLFAYLFKAGVLGKAKLKLGAAPYVLELDMQSKARQISDRDFKKVNLEEFYADSDLGFVVRKPLSKEWTWEKTTVSKIMFEQRGFTKEFLESVLGTIDPSVEDLWREIPALTIRRGAAQTIQYTAETIVEDAQLEADEAQALLQHGEEIVYDWVYIAAVKKESVSESNIKSLLDFFVAVLPFVSEVGPKKLTVNSENTVFLLDCSALAKKVMYNGELGDHIVNNSLLVQENDRYFFLVIISYIQADDKPTKVWEELGTYLHSFRVLKG